MILIIHKMNSGRLCNDQRWRQNADFGTYSECVKEYKVLGMARRRARKNGGLIVKIPEGYTIDRTGEVRDVDGMVRGLFEFVVRGQ